MVEPKEAVRYAKLYGIEIDADFLMQVEQLQKEVKNTISEHIASCLSKKRNPRECIGEIYEQNEDRLAPTFAKIKNILNKHGVEQDYAKLLVAQAIAETISEKIGESNDKLIGEKGICPVCGSLTDLAIIEQNGTVTMRCQFCGYEWPTGFTVNSLSCPYCGYSGKEALSLIRNKMDDRVMVLHCGNCGRDLILVNSKRLRKLPRNLYPLLRVKVESILAALHRVRSTGQNF